MSVHKWSAIALLGLAICGCSRSVAPDETAALPDASAALAMDQHEAGVDVLPLPKRLAFMTGHVEAGLALYRAGESAMAAKHLLHPVSETHAAERIGLDALGFDGDLFTTVADALDKHIPAQQIEPLLLAAEQNLASVAARAGGDVREIIAFLMDTVAEEYAIGVRDGVVSDPGEYQDAFGFTRVAIARSSALNDAVRSSVQMRLAALLEIWPAAPIPPDDPVSVATMQRLVDDVRAALGSED